MKLLLRGEIQTFPHSILLDILVYRNCMCLSHKTEIACIYLIIQKLHVFIS